MSDWQMGDLALCVNDGWLECEHGTHTNTARPVRVGAIYEVKAVASGSSVVAGYKSCPCTSLICGDGLGLADRFVKITPGAKIEGIEEPRRLPVKERADA